MKTSKNRTGRESEAISRFQAEKKAAVSELASSKRLYFGLLGFSIVCEVFGTISMKLSLGFSVLVPTVITLVLYAVSFSLLVKILAHMPLGLVYGIWGGVGSALTMLVGVFVWSDPFTFLTALGLGLVIGGVYLLNKGTDELEKKKAQH